MLFPRILAWSEVQDLPGIWTWVSNSTSYDDNCSAKHTYICIICLNFWDEDGLLLSLRVFKCEYNNKDESNCPNTLSDKNTYICLYW